ncbi:penicillin acylase family protein [Sphingomonas astaxanthinifaciens]|uniref:Penicillin amidase n=1 Tax=Sphingomonas astaxanthinifaciens DSM 22298 TaxID=1123267 RepID=A0ABQ5Z9A2_9SPHN|nr:penicillin acylase family protein [Sphingomonas astaxanthinifaciens]GLR48512.1 penicillin amidase [Sphingomonas astaxanthinifaciens DSM 22298]
MTLALRRTAPLAFLVLAAAAPAPVPVEAQRVSITRDDWGIAHIKGKTDADAVFGMIYAQAEDDFPRIEANYLTALGRTAEAEGEKAIWQDLRARLYVSEAGLKADYAASPPWLRRLMDSWAAGLNYYLATHPEVRPRVLTRFEPWMALSFTEGSIGGDIERIDLGKLQRFYGGTTSQTAAAYDGEPRGSNGIAIAPQLTADGHALLLINPHTSYFFRAEQQVSSEEGLNAYGASTWGQFFIYQGFNPDIGWMHTSSGVDSVDQFAFDVRAGAAQPRYRVGKDWRPLARRDVTLRYRTADGHLASRTFRTWATPQGPIVAAEGRRWIAFAMMDRPVAALQQSFLRTKTKDLASFMSVADLKANSSNNTLVATRKGEVAYLHPQFVPRRDDRFDYRGVVDGSDPRTAWRGLHAVADLPNALRPATGWVQNTNAWPYRAAGSASPDPKRFPRYMDSFGENYRGLHAQALLTGSKGWTLEGLRAAAYDPDQPGFAELLPPLLAAYDALPPADPRRAFLAGPIAALRGWDTRWSAASVPQTLAMFWGEALQPKLPPLPNESRNAAFARLASGTTGAQKLDALAQAVTRLIADFGRWQVPWGEINRFQRISPAIDHPFSDSAPSIPLPFSSGIWGSLASVGSGPKSGTRNWYGTSGNSFVAVVQFGPRVRAVAITAGGESGNPASPHFNDQAQRFAAGDLRPVYFYPDELKGHTERTYRPGQ